MKNNFTLIIVSLLFSFSAFAQTDLILVDFGNTSSPLPWNNFSNPKSGHLPSLINTNGLGTNISLTVIDSFTSINTTGTQSPNSDLGILSSASEDSFFGNSEIFSNDLQPTGAIQLANLDPAKLYDISIFASRVATDNRETQYEITGATIDTAYLNVASNTDSMVVFSLFPRVDGTIDIQASTGPNNNNSFGFFYLGALKIEYEADSVVTPSLNLIQPNGSEYWQVGKNVKIEWTGVVPSQVIISYSIDNGANWNLTGITTQPFQNSIIWEVPNTPSKECLIRVSTDSLQDESEAVFEISADTTECPIVVIGSSTAAGAGASTIDSSWVRRYRETLYRDDTRYPVINIARGGYTTYHLLPTGNPLASGVGITIDTERNITKALSFNPSGVIINLPSNDAANFFSVEDQLTNFDLMLQEANLQDVKVWICTTQPRNFGNNAQVLIQEEVRDSIFSIYGEQAIDFWNGVADANSFILPQYDSGDGVHVNDEGHRLLFERVMGKSIPDSLCGFLSVDVDDFFIEKNIDVQVFPNPFHSEFQIDFKNQSFEKIEVHLFDVYGRLFFEKYIEHVPSGVFSLPIQLSNSNHFNHQFLFLKIRGFEEGRVFEKVVRLIKN